MAPVGAEPVWSPVWALAEEGCSWARVFRMAMASRVIMSALPGGVQMVWVVVVAMEALVKVAGAKVWAGVSEQRVPWVQVTVRASVLARSSRLWRCPYVCFHVPVMWRYTRRAGRRVPAGAQSYRPL